MDPWRCHTVLSSGLHAENWQFSRLLFASCTRYGSCETFTLILPTANIAVLLPPDYYIGSDCLIGALEVQLAGLS